jgi:hypothetical protein
MVNPKWINLPRKDYWLKTENRPRAAAMISAFMGRFGTAVFLLLFAAQILAIQANLSDPVRFSEKIFIPVFVLFLLYLGYWAIAFFRTFRKTGDGAK